MSRWQAYRLPAIEPNLKPEILLCHCLLDGGAYAGGKFLINLLLLVLFFSTYAAKAMFWVGLNHVEKGIGTIQEQSNLEIDIRTSHIQEKLDQLRKTNPFVASELSALLTKLKEQSHLRLTPCFSSECSGPHAVWQVLLQMHEGALVYLTGIALFVYNLLRGALTFLISPLRYEEERSGLTPPYKFRSRKADEVPWKYAWEWTKGRREVYGWLVPCHAIIKWLFWVSIFSLGVHAYQLILNTYVWLPSGK